MRSNQKLYEREAYVIKRSRSRKQYEGKGVRIKILEERKQHKI